MNWRLAPMLLMVVALFVLAVADRHLFRACAWASLFGLSLVIVIYDVSIGTLSWTELRDFPPFWLAFSAMGLYLMAAAYHFGMWWLERRK